MANSRNICRSKITRYTVSHRYSSRAIKVENLSDQDDCSIVHASELSQTHFNSVSNCNNYSYTLWPNNETIYCDPLLNNKVLSITSCNLKKETILCPANSWIFADTDNNTNIHTYKVSLYCPFDHCLPKSSHLNVDLSNPDSQCQFDRTGALCGECKQGFSVILGTPQCKRCSDVYLLLLIPVGLIGIVLVLLFYIFNLTVRTATINTLIFYVAKHHQHKHFNIVPRLLIDHLHNIFTVKS